MVTVHGFGNAGGTKGTRSGAEKQLHGNEVWLSSNRGCDGGGPVLHVPKSFREARLEPTRPQIGAEWGGVAANQRK